MMSKKYQPVIGLEIHAELRTKTKIFCGCRNAFGDERNANCCPGCAAFPGALPVLNREAVRMTIAAGLSLGCEIARKATWDRKSYFYPDLPNAYQITEFYAPLCVGGGLWVGDQFIRLNHIHLEEDAGKLVHAGNKSLLDFNRTGVPLNEIVTEPDMRSSDQAVAFVEKIRRTLIYAGVCDGRMEQGSLRCDANISIMPVGSDVFGTRVEVKNINSFRFIKNAIEYEIKRQSEILDAGGQVVQETRRYDAECDETFSMRSKENAYDYRYFPDPDIPALILSGDEIDEVRRSLPETPESRSKRYTGELGLSEVDADTILASKIISDFFDQAIAGGADPRLAANLIKGDVLRCLNAETGLSDIPISIPDFVKVISFTADGRLSKNGASMAVSCMFTERKSAEDVLREQNLLIEEDLSAVADTVACVLAANPVPAGQYKSGDGKVVGFLMGQCMRELKGKALPKAIQDELIKQLEVISG